MGFEPVRSSQSIADRFRSIHMVLFDRKRNFSGPPLGGLAKNKSKSDHFKWFDVCPDATLNVSILAVSGSQGARLRGPSGSTGPRGKEIYCQTGGAPGAGIVHSIFCSQMNRTLSCFTEAVFEARASDIGDDQLVYRC
jgi:hypothetical protein